MVEELKYSVILFLSANHAVRAENILLKDGLTCKLIPVPRNISSDCGVCIRINRDDKEKVNKVVSNLNIIIVNMVDI